ncbi:MAG: hypothetical protein IPK48_14265 [Gammaproteobacteria bacterium]|nr:hypothetical protein [Gammaproteobacteria bacterium]
MAQETLLRNARVIDCISKQPRDGVSILIRGERIVKVDAQIDVGADTDVIDCTGKTLMPGLIDTHVHATMVDEIDLQLFLGAGVTTARDVGGKLEKVLALRGRVNSGAVLGPRLFVCGPLLDGRGATASTTRASSASCSTTCPTWPPRPARSTSCSAPVWTGSSCISR